MGGEGALDPAGRDGQGQPGGRVDVGPDPDRVEPGQHQAGQDRAVRGPGHHLVAGRPRGQAHGLVGHGRTRDREPGPVGPPGLGGQPLGLAEQVTRAAEVVDPAQLRHVGQQGRVVADQGRVAFVAGDGEVGVAPAQELLGRPGQRPVAAAHQQGRRHQHGGQGDELGQDEAEAVAGEAVGEVDVGVGGAEARPQGGGQGHGRPAGGQGGGGQGAGRAAGDPEGTGAVGLAAAQPDQGREHDQVGQGEQGDGQGQGGAEVAAVVVTGHGEGGQGVVPVATTPAARVAVSGVPVRAETRPRAGGPPPVEAGRGLGPRGRHHPGEAVGDQDPEEGQGGQPADRPGPGPVDGEHRGQGVDEAGQAGEPLGRDDLHDGQHRHGVQGAGEGAGADDRSRHVPGRVAELLGGRRGQLEAEEV